MQPSDFLPTFDLSSGSPCFRPTSAADASSWPGSASTRFRVPVGVLVSGSPASRTDSSRSGQDLPGYWAVLFVRATVNHPARTAMPSPSFSCGHGTVAFRKDSSLGSWHFLFVSRPYPRGSHVRRPTHRRDGYPKRRKALLPACRAQLWPGGLRAHWTTYRISVGIATSFPFGPALPGRFYPANGHCGTHLRQPSHTETIRSLHAQRKNQGQHTMAPVLYGSQHREDRQLWLCRSWIEGESDAAEPHRGETLPKKQTARLIPRKED